MLDAEEKYDELLQAVEEDDIRGKINLADIFKCNDLFRSYLLKNYAEFSPEQNLRAKEKIDKWALYEVLQQMKYSLYTMSLKSRELNDIVAKLSEDKENADKPLMNGGFDDDTKLMNGSFNPTDDYDDDKVNIWHKTKPKRVCLYFYIF